MGVLYVLSKADKMFSHLSVWYSVPEKDRRDLYEDVIFILEKKEKEEARNLKKRNIKVLKDILESMKKVTYKTRWNEAQKLLFKNQYFTQDMDLQNMDKEDALIVFDEHIRSLEKEHIEDMEKKKRWQRREERKNRDAFLCYLDELRSQSKLTPMSLWVELYSTISADERFNAMLYQQGSTPLDLFKFYVDDLKARYHEDKKVLKEVLKDKQFEVDCSTTFDKFQELVKSDKRASGVDNSNIKLTFQSLMEKAEAKEKERMREEQKKLKKLEQNFKNALRKLECTEATKFEEIKDKLATNEAYLAISTDEERQRIFAEYLSQLQETCLHHIKKKKEKKRKSSKRSSSIDKKGGDKNEAASDSADSEADSDNSDDGGDYDDGEIRPEKSSRKQPRLMTDDANTDSKSKRDQAIDSSKSSSSDRKKHKKSSKKKKTHSKMVSLLSLLTCHPNSFRFHFQSLQSSLLIF